MLGMQMNMPQVNNGNVATNTFDSVKNLNPEAGLMPLFQLKPEGQRTDQDSDFFKQDDFIPPGSIPFANYPEEMVNYEDNNNDEFIDDEAP